MKSNREIKFRLWCENKKEWEKVQWFTAAYNAKTHILEQYTGINDKNDVEIFEGDVVKLNVLIEPIRGEGTYWVHKLFVVEFKEQCYFPQRLTESEIVGNIHENPELLEANNEK